MNASTRPGRNETIGANHAAASLLPPPPPAVPADLTRATPRYKRHAWLAGLGLLAFVALYLGLTAWFCWTSYRLWAYVLRGGRDGFGYGVIGTLAGLLGLFLLGALFFLKIGGDSKKNEITAQDEPELFAFLYALADRVGAPRPHRVFLSARVNAGVFYDLSFLNLLIPTRKNLEIGLGLVNTLNLSEFTAVLAHEFGHFAQRSMAVGRWVYTAQQVAGQVVVARSWLDKLLAGLSAIDLRVAWIGWLMRLIVWSIRSLLDTAFRVVVLAERALGREMEFQADLVSVSVTGSDAIVNALHRLGAADGAWGIALNVLAREAGKGKAVPDLFSLQSRVIEHMGRILNEPDHGASPKIPAENPDQHRVFAQELAEPPRMWSTHPANRDRELNAKRVYVPAELDSRSAFCLFRDPVALRRKVTAHILSEVEKKLEPLTDEEAVALVEQRFDKPFFDERYRGTYLGRSIALATKMPNDMYGETVAEDQIRERLAELYPEELATEIRDLRVRTDERATLEALRDGVLEAPGGVIRHRGQVIPRRSLAALVEEVKGEVETLRKRVETHDRAVRSAHRAAAKALGQGWDKYLRGLVHLHHYAAHAEANLEDAQGYLGNVFAVVTADGSISSSERRRLIVASVELHSALEEVYRHAKEEVKLPPEIFTRLVKALDLHEPEKPPEKIADLLPSDFNLPLADEQNIADWFRVIDSWVGPALRILGALERVSLEMLVETETLVAEAYLQEKDPGPAPNPPVVPGRYQTLTKEEVRERQKQLDLWDRFQIADGFFPTVGRLVVAGAILGLVITAAYRTRPISGPEAEVGLEKPLRIQATMTAYNGLELPVVVEVQGMRLRLEPHQHTTRMLSEAKTAYIRALTESNEEIEAFVAEIEQSGRYVYNVASATTFAQRTSRGGAVDGLTGRLGSPRWFFTTTDYVFQQPPQKTVGYAGYTTKTMLEAASWRMPQYVLEWANYDHEKQKVIAAHAEWDSPASPYLGTWLSLAQEQAQFADLLERRVERHPRDMVALRMQHDAAKGEALAALCEKRREQAASNPEDLDWRYLAVRCEQDETKRMKAFVEEYRKNPYHPYFAGAAAEELWRLKRYDDAFAALETAASVPAQTDRIQLQMARLLRVADRPGAREKIAILSETSPSLRQALALETGEAVPDHARSIAHLAKGELEQAISAARPNPAAYALVAVLAGASEGATKEMIDEALQAPIPSDGSRLTWVTIALLEREGRPHEDVDATMRTKTNDAEAVLSFAKLDVLKKGKLAGEKALSKLSIDTRANACTVALVRSAEHAPASCRPLVKAYLFASERPYFR